MRWLAVLLTLVRPGVLAAPAAAQPVVQEYSVPQGSHPHDVAPARDGGVWFTAQIAGYLGWLDPATGEVREIPLSQGGGRSAPHGVLVGPDGAPWITDGGQNAIVRVDPVTNAVQLFPLPGRNANLNTLAFDRNGVLWFTGQAGVYGRVDPSSGEVKVFDAPRGPGPYGITATPDGSRVFYASLAGSHIAEINLETGQATPIDSPTPGQGARRVWTDSHGVMWVSEWSAGQVGRYDPASGQWQEWKLPGDRPQAYGVYVDEQDNIWLSDWGSNSLVRFDPSNEGFQAFAMPQSGSTIRQINGRPGEVWAAESGLDRLVVIRH